MTSKEVSKKGSKKTMSNSFNFFAENPILKNCRINLKIIIPNTNGHK